jgi:DNA repair exonuclease SbcCD ATPase subunit
MSEQSQTTLLNRIGRWFRPTGANSENGEQTIIGEPGHSTSMETRTTFLRPWAKRDAAIAQLQEGFTTLTDLMGSIRDNLDHQNRRQDELLSALQQLPQVLQSLPESNRVQTETLLAIRSQIEGQSAQQQRLGEILTHIGKTASEQRQVVDELRGRVEDLHKADTTIADYLNNVGTALKDVSQNSASTSLVLSQMRDNQSVRDAQVEQVLHRQGARFTAMLIVTIVIAIAALAAVGVLAYLAVNGQIGH